MGIALLPGEYILGFTLALYTDKIIGNNFIHIYVPLLAVLRIPESYKRFIALYLNSKNKILVKQKIEDGTVNQANPVLREIFRYALACDAASVIVAHNHPSGDPQPSIEDKTFTKTLTQAGDVINIKVLDHIIVARDLESGEVKHYSFADHALL